jgi:hypothetical protein
MVLEERIIILFPLVVEFTMARQKVTIGTQWLDF